MRSAAARLMIAPFESAVALLLIISGIAGLARTGVIDPIEALLPVWEAAALFAVMIAAGVLMIAGAASASRGTEIAGLLFLVAVVTDRFILYGYYLGFGGGFAVTGIFDAAIIAAALARLSMIRKRQVLVRLRSEGHSVDRR